MVFCRTCSLSASVISDCGSSSSSAFGALTTFFFVDFGFLVESSALGVFGALIFDEFPDAVALVGISIIIFAGLLTVLREKMRGTSGPIGKAATVDNADLGHDAAENYPPPIPK